MLPENSKRIAISAAVIIVILVIGGILVSPMMKSSGSEESAPATAQVENKTTAPQSAAMVPAAEAAPAESTAAAATAQAWAMIASESRLGFEGKYTSTTFTGEFQEFDPVIHFDPENLEGSLFDVSVDTASVTTYNADWDSVLGERDWFYFSKYPEAKYTASSFRHIEGNTYAADGVMNLKGHEGPVVLEFTWTEGPDGSNRLEGQAQLIGETEVDRRKYRIGAGDWLEDDTIAFQVLVKVDLLLEKK